MRLLHWFREVFDKIFKKRVQKPPVRQKEVAKVLPNGDLVINGRRYLSPSASKAVDEEFRKKNPELVDCPEWK